MKEQIQNSIETLANFCKNNKCNQCPFNNHAISMALKECPILEVRALSDMDAYNQILKQLDNVVK